MGTPTMQFMMILGLIKHKPDMTENDSKVGNLFLDFLVAQNYKNVWFRIK